MTDRIQILRSSVTGVRPGAGTRQPGELFVNFADKQLGVINASQAPLDLVAVPFFSTLADYATDDIVRNGKDLLRARGAITAGTFNIAEWESISGLPVVISATTPATPVSGLMWLDTSSPPYILKIYDGSTWHDVQQLALDAATTNAADIADNAADILTLQGDVATNVAAIASLGTSKQAASSELTALAALAATGLMARLGAASYAGRTMAVTGTGLTITNPSGIAGNPTFELAAELQALVGGGAGLNAVLALKFFSSNNTHTPTTGLANALVFLQAGGGGGGGASSTSSGNSSSGGGGEGGECAISLLTAAQIGASKAVVIGGGGNGASAGDNNGADGGNSTYGGTLMQSNGGDGGDGAADGEAASGGQGEASGGTGTILLPGQSGGRGNGGSYAALAEIGGRGGDSFFGKGGICPTAGFVGSNGEAGKNYGGGGSGGGDRNAASPSNRSGGNGAGGCCLILEFS